METILELLREYIDFVGSISSVVGLIVTVVIYLSIAKIRRFYIYTARAPVLIEKLEDVASQISEHLNSYEGSTTKTYEILAHAEVTLKSLRRTIKGPTNTQIKNVVNKIQTTCGKRGFLYFFSKKEDMENQKSGLEDIYVSVYKIVIECKEDYEASRWER